MSSPQTPHAPEIETADQTPQPPCPPYSRRQFQPNTTDVYAVDWLIYRASPSLDTPTIPEIRLVGIFATLTQARQAAGFGSLNLRVLRENRLSSADFQALDVRRRQLQDDEQAGVVIPLIRRCEYFLDRT